MILLADVRLAEMSVSETLWKTAHIPGKNMSVQSRHISIADLWKLFGAELGQKKGMQSDSGNSSSSVID